MPMPSNVTPPERATLLELLDGLDDPAERERLVRAWRALAPLARVVQMPPPPAGRLAEVLAPAAQGAQESDELDSRDLGFVVGGTGAAPAAPPSGQGADADWLAGTGPEPASDARTAPGACSAGIPAGLDVAPEDSAPRRPTEPVDSEAAALLLTGEIDDPTPSEAALPQGGENDGDVFLFDDDDGDMAIADFDPARDRLRFAGLHGLEDLTVTAGEAGTRIEFRRTRLLLQGLALSADEVLALVDED